MQKTLFFVFALVLNFGATASERNYQSGDGDLDIQCSQANKEARPYAQFNFEFLYDANSGKSGFDLISDENLSSGNGDIAYRISITQTASRGSEEVPKESVVSGCEAAIVRIEVLQEDGAGQVYFECSGDGDAGFGQLNISAEGEISGQIQFPEGQPDYGYPEDTQIDLNCSFK